MYILHTCFPFWIELRILISYPLMFEASMILFYTHIQFPGKSVSDGLQERPFRVPCAYLCVAVVFFCSYLSDDFIL